MKHKCLFIQWISSVLAFNQKWSTSHLVVTNNSSQVLGKKLMTEKALEGRADTQQNKPNEEERPLPTCPLQVSFFPPWIALI